MRGKTLRIIAVVLIVCGFLTMIVPVMLFENTVGESMWEYILPVLIGAGITYLGVELLNYVGAWWWH